MRRIVLGETDPQLQTVPSHRRIVASKFQHSNVDIVFQMPLTLVEQGRKAWEQLHSYTGCDPEWYANWKKTIPSFGCSCRRDFDAIEKELPPDFSSDDAFFIRGVEWHNAVNRKLNKPEITTEEARSIWRKE